MSNGADKPEISEEYFMLGGKFHSFLGIASCREIGNKKF